MVDQQLLTRLAARGSVLLLLIGAFALRVGGAPQQASPRNPPLVIDSLYGPDLFKFYCAPCHGRDGKGHGPVAEALKRLPPDLTQITRRHGGVFPRALIEAFVTNDGGRLVQAHGTAEMPLWGPTFRSLDASDIRVKVRISNLIDYIESIQAPIGRH